jgi:4-amino-4-deoxy-L-arabinose transferase-like glycosyltransferase
MTRRKNSLLAVMVLAVTVHAALLFIVIPQASKRAMISYNQDRFADGYDQLADNLVQGHGYRFYPDTAPTMMREPGYPVFLAGLELLFGSNFTAVKVANLCLALATAWLMTRLATRISKNEIVAIAPPLLFLFHPATLIAESRGGVETLFTFLSVLFLLVLYAAMEREGWTYYALSGAVLGATVLVRSTPMIFPLFLLGYLLWFDRKSSRPWIVARNVALMLLAMLAALSPWIVRNYGLSRHFVPTASVLGVSAHAGQFICAHHSEDKAWFQLDHEATEERTEIAHQLGYHFRDDSPYYQSFYTATEELKFSSYLAHRVFAEYARHPLFCVKCMSLNAFNFWFTGKTGSATAMNLVVQLPYLMLAIVGVWRCMKARRFTVIGPLVLFVLYVMAVHIPILAQARYSVPLVPLLSILACFAVVAPEAADTENGLDTHGAKIPSTPATLMSAHLVGSGAEKY